LEFAIGCALNLINLLFVLGFEAGLGFEAEAEVVGVGAEYFEIVLEVTLIESVLDLM